MLPENEKLSDENSEQISGGNTNFIPTTSTIKFLDLSEYVKDYERTDIAGLHFGCDGYYQTNRGNGQWKKVGSEDMLAYVKRTIGESDPRYIALKEFCDTGKCNYKGGTYASMN